MKEGEGPTGREEKEKERDNETKKRENATLFLTITIAFPSGPNHFIHRRVERLRSGGIRGGGCLYSLFFLLFLTLSLSVFLYSDSLLISALTHFSHSFKSFLSLFSLPSPFFFFLFFFLFICAIQKHVSPFASDIPNQSSVAAGEVRYLQNSLILILPLSHSLS